MQKCEMNCLKNQMQCTAESVCITVPEEATVLAGIYTTVVLSKLDPWLKEEMICTNIILNILEEKRIALTLAAQGINR